MRQLTEELHKPIISKFEKLKVQISFKDNICDVDLPDMQLLSKSNKVFQFHVLLIIIVNMHELIL